MEKTKRILRFQVGEHTEAGNLMYYKLSVNFSICMFLLLKITVSFGSLATLQLSRKTWRMNLWLLEGKDAGRDRQGVLGWTCHTVMFKTENQQGLLYSTWNSFQCYVADWMGGV